MPEPKVIGHQVRFPNTLMGLFQKGWWEIPHIMGATGMALIGMGLAFYGCMEYNKRGGDRREYKSIYTVVRSDDPTARNFVNSVFTSYGKPADDDKEKKKEEA